MCRSVVLTVMLGEQKNKKKENNKTHVFLAGQARDAAGAAKEASEMRIPELGVQLAKSRAAAFARLVDVERDD